MNLVPHFLEKAQEAVRAADLLLDHDCHGSAVNRAYYATFHAARAALVAGGVSGPAHRWSHEAIQGAFSQLIHRRKVYPSRLRAYLSELRAVRDLADYGVEMIGYRVARTMVGKAREFVEMVAKEIAR